MNDDLTALKWFRESYESLPEDYNIYPYFWFDYEPYISIQLNGAECVLLPNGRWYMNDTSGG